MVTRHLLKRDSYEICFVCNWEDDGQDNKDADEIWGGPNYELSLTENRLQIGKQLNIIAEAIGGAINLDTKSILKILSNHSDNIGTILNKFPDDADLDHPLVSQYDVAGQELLKQLVVK